MKKIILIAVLVVSGCVDLFAQRTISFQILEANSKNPLLGATVQLIELDKISRSDSAGIVLFQSVPTGSYSVLITYVGFSDKKVFIHVPQMADSMVEVLLEEREEEEEEIIVTATRIS